MAAIATGLEKVGIAGNSEEDVPRKNFHSKLENWTYAGSLTNEAGLEYLKKMRAKKGNSELPTMGDIYGESYVKFIEENPNDTQIRNPSEGTFCVCGHTIKDLYLITYKNEFNLFIPVGSVCIKNFRIIQKCSSCDLERMTDFNMKCDQCKKRKSQRTKINDKTTSKMKRIQESFKYELSNERIFDKKDWAKTRRRELCEKIILKGTTAEQAKAQLIIKHDTLKEQPQSLANYCELRLLRDDIFESNLGMGMKNILRESITKASAYGADLDQAKVNMVFKYLELLDNQSYSDIGKLYELHANKTFQELIDKPLQEFLISNINKKIKSEKIRSILINKFTPSTYKKKELSEQLQINFDLILRERRNNELIKRNADITRRKKYIEERLSFFVKSEFYLTIIDDVVDLKKYLIETINLFQLRQVDNTYEENILSQLRLIRDKHIQKYISTYEEKINNSILLLQNMPYKHNMTKEIELVKQQIKKAFHETNPLYKKYMDKINNTHEQQILNLIQILQNSSYKETIFDEIKLTKNKIGEVFSDCRVLYEKYMDETDIIYKKMCDKRDNTRIFYETLSNIDVLFYEREPRLKHEGMCLCGKIKDIGCLTCYDCFNKNQKYIDIYSFVKDSLDFFI